MSKLSESRFRSCAGLSLVEALVVVGVLAVLAAVLIPVLSGVRENSRRAACADNLRNIGGALEIFASEHRGRLPVMEGAGEWPWDTSVAVLRELLQRRTVRDTFYCPSGPVNASEELWNLGVRGFGQWEEGYRVIGYVLLLEGVPRVRPEHTHARLPLSGNDPAAGEKELAVDAVISFTGGRHGTFDRNTYPGEKRPDRTNHLDGTRPAGGNILFLDGHVAWRDFEDMDDTKVRGMPMFWW